MNSAESSPKRKSKGGRDARGHWMSTAEFAALQDRLREAQETLDAIRGGEVDAVVVSGEKGSHVYSLAGAEQPYRVYVEQMQEGAVTVSAQGIILFCNQRFAGMLNLPLERVISSSLTDRISPGTWEKISSVLTEDVDVVKLDDVVQTEQNGLTAACFTASRLPLEDQAVICLVVADLTLLREQENLRLAKEVADKANEAKDVFLAALSHELRTPLTPALMAAADMETNPQVPGEFRETAGLIRRCIEMETRLIDDLLDITRIVRGKLELKLGPVDLHVALRRALMICQNDITGKQLRVDVSLDAAETATLGDMVRIQQAFWNVIRNAVKFTPQGGHIAIRSGNDAEKRVWFEVVDTGIGFDEASGARLFNAFEQGGESVTRRYGGLGLGLAICRTVVDAHGGSVSGHSRGLGTGATFTIRLPLQSISQFGVLEGSPPGHSSSHADPRSLRLLLVEDHKDTSQTMQKLLRHMGHHVTIAESADGALQQAATKPFDLVISDLGLPDMSGFALMQILRDRHGLKGIAVSGFGSSQDVADSRSAGFVHHLTKPISIERLKAMLLDFDGETTS